MLVQSSIPGRSDFFDSKKYYLEISYEVLHWKGDKNL